MTFRKQLDAVLRSPKGQRVLEEAQRLARDPLTKERIVELRRKVRPVPTSRTGPPRD